MSETNKTYRIRTEVGTNKNITVDLQQDYNTFEILSLQLNQEDTYRLQTVNYGVVVGRVLANDGFGVPNAKISVFIETDEAAFKNVVLAQLYPYTSTRDTVDDVRYNLLPDEKVDVCHRPVGTFPSKTYLLDNDDVIEIFEKYYKYTTRTNNSGDFIICGVPTGNQTIHMDLDLSDCGVLSQKPRDFYYKGYNVEQFENPNQFKTSKNLDSLSQIFSQDQIVEVIPFWGNRGQGQTIGVTRCDINVNFKFEPTCVFIGSIVSDNSSNGISKKCLATNTMGAMDEMVTGEGTIEMIRKTQDGDIEEFRIKGTELINQNGVWCYQIPMNLDYMMTDEYGNMVPTDNPNKGIPTRTSVRFRVSMHDMEENTDNYFLSKVLVPNNPETQEEVDYNFGTYTKDTSFRDLFWNDVYTIKSYIPRIQHSLITTNERFTGIKHTNINGNNNPMPYNNIRIRIPLMFSIMCVLIKTYIRLVALMNSIIYYLQIGLGVLTIFGKEKGDAIITASRGLKYVVLSDGLCPDIENWYFAPGGRSDLIYIVDAYTRNPSPGQPDGETGNQPRYYNMMDRTLHYLMGDSMDSGTHPEISGSKGDPSPLCPSDDENDAINDKTSVDYSNSMEGNKFCLTNKTDYLVSCIEMNLAQEYRVINFDFYNDWINGTIYLPRWNKYVTKKRRFLFGLINIPAKIKGCLTSANGGNNSVSFTRTRKYTQQCALKYDIKQDANPALTSTKGCAPERSGFWSFLLGSETNKQKCHNVYGFQKFSVFGKNGGIIAENITSKNQYVYYVKPCEWDDGKKVNLFATDIVLLGTLNDCSQDGLPQAFKHLASTTYVMPTNLALTNMDNDGYVYAGEEGTICTTSKNYNNQGVKPIESSFSATEKYYSASKKEEVRHEVLDDYAAITDASGIAWNYTGPDQGTMDYVNNFYQPGGHFIGMSCFNSQTNIKSCVNLSRICEAGTSMSQRREIVREIEVYSDGTPKTYRYRYFVPTGFVSKDCIVDSDFRSMFATMNHNRLIASEYDERTGYPKYKLSFKYPASFDGGLESSGKFGSVYNERMTTPVEYDRTGDNEFATVYDAIRDITANTYTRTTYENSRDYYFFRFGLNNYNVSEQQKKFLKVSDGYYVLPMYENSFYFYFGLRHGATALDELNKQFFASCGNELED